MKSFLSAAVVLASLTSPVLSSPASADQAGRSPWFVGRLDGEKCVRLDNIGPYLERLHFGSGQMHTPEDFVRSMAAIGASPFVLQPERAPQVRVFVGNGEHPEQAVIILLFNDLAFCKAYTSGYED